jgi:hypothetical protein
MNDVDLLNLHRVAQAARDLGHYNLAKLLEAARTSLVTRTGRAGELPLTDTALLGELAALEQTLNSVALHPELLAAIRNAHSAIAHKGMALLEDAPPVFVCRHCGQVALRQAPEACPACGAGGLTFEEIIPAHYLQPEPPERILAQLRAFPDTLEGLLAGLTEEQAARKVPGAEGEWSLREAARHLRDSNRLLAYRVNLLLTETNPDLKPQTAWGMSAATPPDETTAAIAVDFRRERAGLLQQLAPLSPADWQRAGWHGEFGRVTLIQQATYFAKHEHWHLAQMTRLRRELSGTA